MIPGITAGGIIVPAGDPYFSDVTILMHFEGSNGSTTFTDSSSVGNTATAFGNAQLSTTGPLVGGSSLILDGSGDYFTIPNSIPVEPHTGPFTLEWTSDMAVMPPGATDNSLAFATVMGMTNGGSEWLIGLNATALIIYYGLRTVNQAVVRLFWPSSLSAGTPVNLAFQRDGSDNWACYKDGVRGTQYQVSPLAVGLSFGSVTTGTYTDGRDLSSGDDLMVGEFAAGLGSFPYNGKLDELRFTKSVARYGSSYTPALPFPDA